jgi:hypothetical protein
VLNALRHHAGSVVGVEINPMTVHAVRDLFREQSAALNRSDVEAVVAEGRSFLRSRDARYDLIEINSVDTLSALSTGAYVLGELPYTSDAVSTIPTTRGRTALAMAVGDLDARPAPAPPSGWLDCAPGARAPGREGSREARGRGGRAAAAHAHAGQERALTPEELAKIDAFAKREHFASGIGRTRRSPTHGQDPALAALPAREFHRGAAAEARPIRRLAILHPLLAHARAAGDPSAARLRPHACHRPDRARDHAVAGGR